MTNVFTSRNQLVPVYHFDQIAKEVLRKLYCFDRHEQHFSIIDGPHHSSIYLALNAGQAAGTGLRVTYPPAAAPTLLSGHAEGTQLVLLLHVDASDPRGTEQGAPPPCSQRLEEEVIIHLRVVHIKVIFGDVIQRQGIRLHG